MEGRDLSCLDNEVGGHRIQRVPKNDRHGRVHSSTVTVAVIHAVADRHDIRIADKDLKVEFYSGTGAGGQHRNKHRNSCRIVHLPTGLTRSAQTRSRETSHREALSALLEDLRERSRKSGARAVNGARRDQVGLGERSDKRRTYRFQEDRVVDHITGKSASCSMVMSGRLDLLA
jgi:peptide chain release factor 1